MLNDIVFHYEKQMEHHKWIKEIPYLTFPEGWQIQVAPPFSGAVVRFMVKYKDAKVSIYLDCYGNLGACSMPYWEVYPCNGDVARIEMLDANGLIELIRQSINEQAI